jgi:hypothetical protein
MHAFAKGGSKRPSRRRGVSYEMSTKPIRFHPEEARQAFAGYQWFGRDIIGMVFGCKTTNLATDVAIAMIDWIDPVSE